MVSSVENLLEQLGGMLALERIADEFCTRVSSQSELRERFHGIPRLNLRENRVAFLIHALVSASPETTDALKRLPLNNEQFDAFINFVAEMLFDMHVSDETIQTALVRLDAARAQSIHPETQAVVRMTLKLPKSQQYVSVNILNEASLNRRHLDVGMVKAGLYTIEWDRRDDIGRDFPAGNYKVEMFVDGLLVKKIAGVLK